MPKINPTRILFEDEHLLAINKLSRELVVRGKGKMEKLPLLDFLRQIYGKNLKALHRLDFETSGIVLFSKTDKAYEEAIANRTFVQEGRDVKKIYRAIVMGRMSVKRGAITKPLPSRTTKDPLPAATNFSVLRVFGDTSLVEAEMESGRHHQIRKHFASIGHPLVLDDEYGNLKFNKLFTRAFHYSYFFLHSYRLEFRHFITAQPVKIVAPLPNNFEEALKKLGTKG